MQGCIPVVFDVLTASVMYTWHWEEQFWKDVIVEMLHHPVAFRYSDPVAVLKTMLEKDEAGVRRKQRLLRSRVFQLQYGLDGRFEDDLSVRGLKGPINASSTPLRPNWPIHPGTGLPMDDAFDVCIDLCLGWHSGRVPDVRNATVPECWNGWLDKAANKCRPGPDPAAGKVVKLS